ncbi:MAG: DUF1186 domain-containing protein [Thermodesulfobacteriota bacterium]|nr:DUF1186 domain-containing protein [Thermodesulfobacteriota bacterium]
MNCKEILLEIKDFDGQFPRQALEEAVDRQGEITPLLLEILENAALHHDSLQKNRSIAHIYAMFLLAQFREKKAHPLIVRFFSLPGDISLELTGDLVTENLGSILASTCDNDISLLTSLIENHDINEYVRGAALEALLCLVAAGKKTDEEISAYFDRLFKGALEREPSHTWNFLVDAAARLCPEEMMMDLEQAYDDGLVNHLYISAAEAKKLIKMAAQEKQAALEADEGLSLVNDVIAEMESWACFRPGSNRQEIVPEAKIVPVRQGPKIGRNQPCPCGSGKKYKKCCLRKEG